MRGKDEDQDDPGAKAERYLAMSDPDDEPRRNRNGDRKPNRFARYTRVAKGLNGRRMIMLAGMVGVVALLSFGSMAFSYHERVTRAEAQSACSQARSRLIESAGDWARAKTNAKRSVDLDLLEEADPTASARLDTLLNAKEPPVMECDTDPATRTTTMTSGADRLNRETKELKSLTTKASSKTGAYAQAKAAKAFDTALAKAEHMASTVDKSTLLNSYLMDRLQQEIRNAKELPRSASLKDVQDQTSMLTGLMDRIEQDGADSQ
ncbi:hypothetical protein CSQ85_09345 [Bifidobacterium rousetti]|uniref:hypothetical protein n=1 Tax=Bifidobacterium rousetti TaxID=2045439 RepID=UPI00123A9F8A|nr:hypothetical protein [Bifidobacterium rousetti]KAA8818356.1 hypothetical protein CSQ85_09345 [Bifidobacterium rousetti]